MLKTLQDAVNNIVSSASGGALTELRLETPPPGKGDAALCLSALAKSLGEPMPTVRDRLHDSLRTLPEIARIEVAGPYLNIRLADAALFAAALDPNARDAIRTERPERIMVEYLSPNTNKPLHLGHLRNGIIGTTLAKLLASVGHRVIPAILINDRGEHICKSIWGYQREMKGETPASAGRRGDKFVGDCYVAYDRHNKARQAAIKEAASRAITEWSAGNQQIQDLVQIWNQSDDKKVRDQALKNLVRLVPKASTARDLLIEYDADPEIAVMLQQWEAGDPELRALWATMNDWFYEGFERTNARFRFFFDKVYYESELYTLGKDMVKEGLERGVFVKDEAGAIRFPLPIGKHGTNPEGGPRKPKVLNEDGTSGYLTQDIGTAVLKVQEYGLDRSVYVVANEQDHHFQSLFAILEALEYPWANQCYHLSYAMVYLPEGKMKSREGTVVDADDLADTMAGFAAEAVRARNPELDDVEVARRAEVIGIVAIKFYLLHYNANKSITFDPRKTISFDGDTGPYCLYSYARARGIMEKATAASLSLATDGRIAYSHLGTDAERACALELLRFNEGIERAAEHYAPSIVTERMLSLAHAFNAFYMAHPVVTEDRELARERLTLVAAVAEALRFGFSLLEIEPLEKM